MGPELLYPGQLRLPFLHQSAITFSSNDPQQWAELVRLTVPVRVCEPLRLSRPFRNRTALVDLGKVRAIATHGSPISVRTDHTSSAQLLLPYRGNGFWTCDGRGYDNPVGQSVLFLPAAPLRLENTITSGVSLNMASEDLLETAQTMAGPDGIGRDLSRVFGEPQRLLWRQAGQQGLIECLYRTLTHADRSLQAMAAGLQLLRLDDLLLRLTVLLLVPELRDPGSRRERIGSAPTQTERLTALTAWIEAHLNQPIGLTDLERQAGCSRRSLQYQFRRRFQCTPMQWLRRRRLERALELLRLPAQGQTVWQVAQSCGYSNLSAFSRDFRNWHGQRASDVLAWHRSRAIDTPAGASTEAAPDPASTLRPLL